ncbi:hypothetical protein ACFL2Z_03865, partial [Candidatus Eisenbacteria bacterium]
EDYVLVGEWDWPAGMGAVGVDDSGRVYVADRRNRIVVFSTEGEYLYKWGGFYSIEEMGADRRGNVYVADWYLDTDCVGSWRHWRIQKFRSDGTWLAGLSGCQGYPSYAIEFVEGIAPEPAGGVYVGESSWDYSPRIRRRSSSLGLITSWTLRGVGDAGLCDIAASDNGYVFAAVRADSTIHKYTADGLLADRWPAEGIGPIAVDHDENVYIGGSQVMKYTSDGTLLATWSSYGTHGIAVDADGYVYVSTGDRRIQKFGRLQR